MTLPTPEQRSVLAALRDARDGYLTPSEIGYAMTDGRQWPLKPQGAGRVGGGMARRLMVKGWIEDASRLRSGFPAYRITPAGRKALDARP